MRAIPLLRARARKQGDVRLCENKAYKRKLRSLIGLFNSEPSKLYQLARTDLNCNQFLFPFGLVRTNTTVEVPENGHLNYQIHNNGAEWHRENVAGSHR